MVGAKELIRSINPVDDAADQLNAEDISLNSRWQVYTDVRSSSQLLLPTRSHLRVLLFGVPGWQQGTEALPKMTTPVTSLDDIPEDLQLWERLHLGAGLRLANNPNAMAGAAERYKNVGVYAVTLDEGRIADRTRFPHAPMRGTKLIERTWTQVAGVTRQQRHLNRRLAARRSPQGQPPTAIAYRLPPSAVAIQAERGITQSPDDRLFIILQGTAQKLGEVSIPTAQTLHR